MSSIARSVVWVAVALAATMSAAAADEWRITNSQPVNGVWSISEVKFFADNACSEQLAIVQGSAYVSPLRRRTIPAPEPLAHDATEDCWGRCGARDSGLCGWCGRGNACCRAGFPLDPPECHYAMRRMNEAQHRCVGLLPAGREMAEVRTSEAFDDSYKTTLNVSCEHDVCTPGALVLGVSIARSAEVQCVLVVEPQPQHGHNPLGRRIWLQRARRPAQMCPGMCRSGQHLECGSESACQKHNSTGVCTQHLSPNGTCGSGPAERAGVDCTGCRALPNVWEAVPMMLANAKSFGPPVPLLVIHRGEKYAVTAMRHNQPVRHQPNKLRGAPKPEPLPQGVEDCWAPCQGRGGFCSYCGTGRACCRRGFDEDPEECKHAVGHSVDLHQCVRIVAEHEGTECLERCDGKAGMCSWCGAGGACCKRGDGNDPPECQGAMGFLTHGKQHECVRVPVPHEGEDCWSPCGGKSGSCPFCGMGNACCRAGAEVRLPHSEGMDTLDAPECRFATGFVKTHHECVRLAHSEHNGSIAVGADGSAEVLLDATPSVARKAIQRDIPAAQSEEEVQAHYKVYDGARARAGKTTGSLMNTSALGAPTSSASLPQWRGAPTWMWACALSAILVSMLAVACVVLLAGRQHSWHPSEVPLSSQTRLPRLLRSASTEFSKNSVQCKGRLGECADDKSKLF